MIIGYDFWADGVYYDAADTDIIVKDNDGVSFDTCNTISSVNEFVLKGGTYDEFYAAEMTYDNNGDTSDVGIIENAEKPTWSSDTVLLAKFQENLIAGTIGIDGQSIDKIEIRRRKKGEEEWQTYFTIDYDSEASLYTIVDKFVESEESYEYCIRPIAGSVVGTDSLPYDVYISYDHAHIFDNTASYDLIYNLQIGTISKHIGANVVETLSSKYPYVIYGQNDYEQGSIDCLLVSEESATGNIDVKSEKILRNNILSFLCNKQYKILKNSDGLYMLVKIIGTPTITANEMIGSYNLSFEYVQVDDVNNMKKLSATELEFDYFTTKEKTDNEGNKIITTEARKNNIG